MARLVAVLIAGLLTGVAATWFVLRPAAGPEASSEVVRDLVVSESVSAETAAEHRANRYQALTSIAGVLALPGRFDRYEALYALAGRSDAAETQALIFEANRIADEVQRAGFLDVLFARLTDVDAPSALALARTGYFRGDKAIEQSVWATWGRNDLAGALFAATTQPNDRARDTAAQSLYRAFGDAGNETTRHIENELGIPPDLETRSRYVYRLADRSIAEAIDYLNGLPTSYDKLDLTLRLANYLSVSDPQAALSQVDRINDATHRVRVRNILEAAAARSDPHAVIERILAGGGNPSRSSEFGHAVTALASRDLDEAIAVFERATSAEARRAIGSTIAVIMTGKDVDAAVEWVRANADSTGSRHIYESIQMSLLNAIARHDPARAIAEAQTLIEGPQGRELLANLFESMASREPADMVGYLDLIENPDSRRDIESRVAMRWMQRDPEAALEFVLGLDEEQAGQILQRSSWSVMENNLDAAIRLLPRLPADVQPGVRSQIAQRLAVSRSPAEAQAFIRQFEYEPGFARLQASLISGVAQTDVVLARQMADQVADQDARDSAYLTVISQHAQTNAQEAASWIDRIGGEAQRAQAISMVAQYWASQDIDAAVRWASAQPAGTARDDAVMRLAMHWEGGGRRALELAGSIQDEQKRGQAQMGIVIRMAGKDRARARELLDGLDLPDNLRQQAEQMLLMRPGIRY